MRLGAGLGHLFRMLAPRRRRIAAINLKLCFPERSDAQREALLRAHFASIGIGLMEIALAWWGSDAKIQPLFHGEGLEHLQQALKEGKGVILFNAHFTTLDFGSRYLLYYRVPMHVVYRPHESPLVEYIMRQSRAHHAEKAIPRDAVRDMVRSLRANKPLWFAPDQNYGLKYSVFADFFGVPAATNTTTARLARMTGARVVPFFSHRLPACKGYRICLQPALEDFPSGDDKADAERLNQVIEEAVRISPEQYLWVHRRFKDRPQGEERFY